MKTLHDESSKHGEYLTLAPLQYQERQASAPREVFLLLHGLDERGRRISRKLAKYLPEDSLILAPNAPYPLPRQKTDRIEYGYAWYFYDRFTQSYHVDQTLAIGLLKALLKEKNPDNLPVTIIGFSQGGYLAPLVATEVQSVRTVIGVGCEFRPHFFQQPVHFSLHAIHGQQDNIIKPEQAYGCVELLRHRNVPVSWDLIPRTAHEISPEVGLIIKRIIDAKRSL